MNEKFSMSEQALHEAIWQEVQKSCLVPGPSWVAQSIGADKGLVARYFKRLVKAGVLEQPYGHGSYRLLCAPDGTPLQNAMVIGGQKLITATQ